ncbi:hypothetical protein TIFTF001_032529 [Ficus carica]|uniref:Uncharacterized protein n=1 Tax=Ficus carica TaxID=3494 RepID=A0AA88J2J0_FICCA|nr:hypothetical protein TIFTF001_032529 [Ficus carica]
MWPSECGDKFSKFFKDYTTKHLKTVVYPPETGGLHDGPSGPSCKALALGGLHDGPWWTVVFSSAHFLLQAAANSVIAAAAAANSVVAAAVVDVAAAVAAADSLVLECLFIFKEN